MAIADALPWPSVCPRMATLAARACIDTVVTINLVLFRPGAAIPHTGQLHDRTDELLGYHYERRCE